MVMRLTRTLFLVATLLSPIVVGEVGAKEAGEPFDREAWKAEVVRLGLDPEDVIYPFEASPEMTGWAEAVMAATNGLAPKLRLSRLQQAMFEPEVFDFAYDDTRTLTAEEAFSARRGNCMSFTALFIAMSRSVGIPTFLMAVRRDPEVGRDDGLVILNRHVVAGHRAGGQISTFDFQYTSESRVVGGLVIDDVQASAMFHANLGGAALRNNDLAGALHNFEITTTLTPDWAAGWVNLGVALAHLGDVDRAFSAYRKALEIDPGNSSALNNMSFLYSSLGREAEARVALRAATQRTESPFTLLAMADSEMLVGNDREAQTYLKRAKRRYPWEPEVYDGLARLATRMDEHRRAEKYRRKAERLRGRAAGQH